MKNVELISLGDGRVGAYYGNPDIKYSIETNAMVKYITENFDYSKTNGLDLGCGKRRSLPCAISVDLVRGPTVPYGWWSNPDLIGDASNLPFKDETIDWITAAHLIEHFDNPLDIISEWLRVLKVGGVISLIVPIAELTGKVGEAYTDVTHKKDYSVDSFNSEVVDKLTGVSVVELRDLKIGLSFVAVLMKTEDTSVGDEGVSLPFGYDRLVDEDEE